MLNFVTYEKVRMVIDRRVSISKQGICIVVQQIFSLIQAVGRTSRLLGSSTIRTSSRSLCGTTTSESSFKGLVGRSLTRIASNRTVVGRRDVVSVVARGQHDVPVWWQHRTCVDS
jgi:hypothetical protein